MNFFFTMRFELLPDLRLSCFLFDKFSLLDAPLGFELEEIPIDIDDDINELSLLEFIHNMVETLDKYFENVCELDVSALCFV